MLNRLCKKKKTIVRKLRTDWNKKKRRKEKSRHWILLRNLGEIEKENIENKNVRVHLGIFLMDIALARVIV